MNKDLASGDPTKTLWLFCIPLFGSVIFQQLYNLADSFVAGRFIGENALAAVGNSYELTLFFIAFGFGCNIGCSVITSEFFGAKRYREMKTAISTSLIASAVVCILLMLLGLLFGDMLLQLINTPAEIFSDSALYLTIYVLGLPFLFFYNVSTGIFAALGDSQTPFWFLACSSVANIGMDIVFVRTFHMGVSGVAWATFLCQGISCILVVIFVYKRLQHIHCEGIPLPFDKEIFRKFLSIAGPSTIQQSFISVGNIIIQRVINGFGPATIAGYAAAVKLNNLVITSFTTIGNGISNFTAQNIGARQRKRIKIGFTAGLKMVWVISILPALPYFFFGDTLMFFFMKEPSQDAIRSGFMFLKIVAPFYPVVSAKLVSDGILRGAGLMSQFMAGTFTDLILRVLLAFLLSRTALGYIGIWSAWPVGWVIATTLSIFFYCRNMYHSPQNDLSIGV